MENAKCRGQVRDSYEWIYGALYDAGRGRTAIIQEQGFPDDEYEEFSLTATPVYWDTVDFSSGRLDKNEAEIYEDDILRYEGGLVGLVCYGEHMAFCPVDKRIMETVGFYVSAEGTDDMPLGPTEEIADVIGNIVDMPPAETEALLGPMVEGPRREKDGAGKRGE